MEEHIFRRATVTGGQVFGEYCSALRMLIKKKTEMWSSRRRWWKARSHKPNRLQGAAAALSAGAITAIQESAVKMFDSRHGGFGQEPKFPHPSTLDLLIERYAQPEMTAADAGENAAKIGEIVNTTLEQMARGGVYDQLAGGFHRYSVDERWVVPHFEKMCYDNSELLKNYVHGYQATGIEFFADVAKDIIRWMDEWLSDRERGGFYASQDADYLDG